MKDHGLIFAAESVRAIQERRKSMTRRVPSCANTLVDGKRVSSATWNSLDLDFDAARLRGTHLFTEDAHGVERRVKPVWQPGDRIHVKETWWKMPPVSERDLRRGADTWPDVFYDASIEDWERDQITEWGWKRKSPMFLPKWATRLWLTVKKVRCERIQEISDDDIYREGCPEQFKGDDARDWFVGLWTGLNGERGWGWSLNRPVWVLEFEEVKP